MGDQGQNDERRRGARHHWPRLTVTIDSEQVETADWSTRGFRLEPSSLALAYHPGELVAGTITQSALPEHLPEHLFVGRIARCQHGQRVLAIELAYPDIDLERFEQDLAS